MTLKNTIAVVMLLLGLTSHAQCFQIESILVDACGNQEGLNEMVRFRVGNAALNTSNLSVDWPNNNWQGLVKNTVTAAKTAALNADILDAGGCGELIEPVNGVLPANARVILVTSFNLDTALNQFGPITEDFYILYQNNSDVTGGHFANSGTGLRTLQMSFGSCSDSVTYNRALLIDESGANTAGDGATVLFTANGVPTYINNGCSAPVPPFTVDAGNGVSACAGATISLAGQAQGQQAVQWTSSQGSFSNPASVSTSFTIGASATGTIVLTLTATNTCGAAISDTVSIVVTPAVTPNFATTLALCQNAAVPVLNTTSPNGISGTWSPSVISNTASGTYVFTPNANQCASSVALSVTVSNAVTPDFPTSLALCQNAVAPTLSTTSPNGISGTWNPSVINNTTSGTYVFTPNLNQCASAVTLSVVVSNGVVPDFATHLSLCENAFAPALDTTSPNGISGTWNPSAISTTQSAEYTFTPSPGQCASAVVLSVVVTDAIAPDFATQLSICENSEAPVLANTSPNGITGSWNPSTVSNTQSANYVFTPDSDQCASAVTLEVSVKSQQLEISQGCVGGNYFVSVPDEFASYQWTDGFGNIVGNAHELNVSELAATSPISFPTTLSLTVSGADVCETTKSVVVSGILCTIPKGVSVNGDGMNDTFNLSGYGVSELKIFNRYGLEVYSKRDYSDQWHGQSDNGDDLPDATYYYAITTNSGEIKTGWVYVIRKS